MKCDYCAEECARSIQSGSRAVPLHEACEELWRNGYARCVQCKADKPAGDVSPYVAAAPNGKSVVRWLCRETCRDEWHRKYRAWKAEQRKAG